MINVTSEIDALKAVIVHQPGIEHDFINTDNINPWKNDDGKLISYTRNSNGTRMCVGLPQPYWTSFYQEVDDDDTSNLIYDNTKKNNI